MSYVTRSEVKLPPPEVGEYLDMHACGAALGRAFHFLGKRWNGIILATLGSGPIGFAELRRGVGAITDSVLSNRLTELALAGLVIRTVADTRPPTVRYELTPAGIQLLPIFAHLAQWADRHLPDHQRYFGASA